jgi:predicted flap endonuclease-1-like 5' DNA nuclease
VQALDRDDLMRLYAEQCAYAAELEKLLSRRSQELLEADEREAALVRRFRDQRQRIAELDHQVEDQRALIEQLRASLPKDQPPPSQASELLSIRGIGPKYASTLSTLGIETIAALAVLGVDDVDRIERQLRIHNGRIRRERWIERPRFGCAMAQSCMRLNRTPQTRRFVGRSNQHWPNSDSVYPADTVYFVGMGRSVRGDR